MEIKTSNATELWKKALTHVKEKGKVFTDKDGRECIESFNLVLCLTNAEESKFEEPMDVLANAKKWIYPSKEELVNVIFKDKQAPIYDYTYGGRIFNFQNELDQVNNFIIPLLKQDPNSRRGVVMLFNPMTDANVNNKNAPGMIYIHFRILEEKLNVTCHIRSNDLFFGLPANIYQIYHLLEYVADSLGRKTGSMTFISNSAHIFREDMEDIDGFLGV